MSEFFTNIANENNDELMDELEQLESDNVEAQLAGIEVPQDSMVFSFIA